MSTNVVGFRFKCINCDAVPVTDFRDTCRRCKAVEYLRSRSVPTAWSAWLVYGLVYGIGVAVLFTALYFLPK